MKNPLQFLLGVVLTADFSLPILQISATDFIFFLWQISYPLNGAYLQPVRQHEFSVETGWNKWHSAQNFPHCKLQNPCWKNQRHISYGTDSHYFEWVAFHMEFMQISVQNQHVFPTKSKGYGGGNGALVFPTFMLSYRWVHQKLVNCKLIFSWQTGLNVIWLI